MQYATPYRSRAAPSWAIIAVAALVPCAALTAFGGQEPSKPSPDSQRQLRSPVVAPRSNPSPAGKPAKVAAAESPSPQKQALPFDEEIPPGGVDNLMFSDAAIRYCLAQIIRIDAVRALVDRYERAQVDYFNGLVADYNNRCGHYRYMEGARESAQAVVEPNRPKIESDAREVYRKRFAGTDKEALSKSSPGAAATPPSRPTQQARSPGAAVPPTPSAAARPATTTERPEVKQQPPLPTTPFPSTRPSPAATQAMTTAQPEVQQPPPSPPKPLPSAPPSQAAAPAATTGQPEVQQPPPSPPLSSASPSQPVAPATTTARAEVKQQPSLPTTPLPSTPSSHATGPKTTQPQPEVKLPAESKTAPVPAPLPSPAQRAAATTPEAELKQKPKQEPSPATPAPQAATSAVATAQPEAKSQPAGATSPAPVSSESSRSLAITAQPELKQQPRSSVAEPESRPSQAERAVAIAPQPKVKQQPQSPPSLARPADQNEGSPATTPPPPASKPPVLAKAQRDSAHGAAMERFAAEVQRVASQVLDQRDYPKDARGKDWQGTTQIEVRYDAAGYIRSIVVGESSGYPPLDETALQIARNMRLPSAPEELRSRDFAVRFPIVFRLRNP